MTADTTEIGKERDTNTTAWAAAAFGAGVGIAILIYSRRRQSRWDRVKDTASDWMDTARDEVKPWMGVAAGGAAAGSALAAYARKRRRSGWDRTLQNAADVASRVRSQTPHWAGLATAAAIALASTASSRKAQRRVIHGVSENTAETINSLTEKGILLAKRVRNLAEDASKLYPSIQRAIAKKIA
jgi:hypothetical protein